MLGKAYATSCGIAPRKVKTLAGRLRLMSNLRSAILEKPTLRDRWIVDAILQAQNYSLPEVQLEMGPQCFRA